MHSQETSYYEIALTNKQVLGFFVVLLLCVVGAFFSGIWLGKKQSGDQPMFAQAETAAAGPVDAEEPLEELNFFTDEQPAPTKQPARKPAPREQPAESVEVAGTERAGTTLKEDLETEGTPPVVADPPARQAALEPASEPIGTAKAPMTGFVIQVFSSPDEARARQFLERLRGDGYEAFLIREMVDGAPFHRVRIGPFADRSEANRVKPLVAKAYNVEPWVTPVE